MYSGTQTTSVSGNLVNTLKVVIPIYGLKTLSTPSSSVTDPTLGGGQSTGLLSVSGSSHTTKSFSSSLAVFETGWNVTGGDLGQVTVSAGNDPGSATYTDTGAVLFTVDYSYTPTSTPEPATFTSWQAAWRASDCCAVAGNRTQAVMPWISSSTMLDPCRIPPSMNDCKSVRTHFIGTAG